MSKKTAQTIRLVYGIVLSLLLIATGILLMVSCVNIYQIGKRPFTPENISAAFEKIAIPVWITVGAVVVGLILRPILPIEKSKLKARKDKKITLAQLEKKLSAQTLASNQGIRKEQTLRKVLHLVAIILCVASAVPAVVYILNFNHFSENYNASVISACLFLLPCTFLCMGICVALIYLENASVERQLAHVKTALAEAKGERGTNAAKERRPHTKLVLGIRLSLAVVALALIVAGILNGGMADVLAKAVNICTECIGLG